SASAARSREPWSSGVVGTARTLTAPTVVGPRWRRPSRYPQRVAASHRVHRGLARADRGRSRLRIVTSEHKTPSDLSRRSLLAAPGIGAVAVALDPPAGPASASHRRPPGGESGGDPDVPPVAGLHTQFGADSSSQVTVSWHVTRQVSHPRVYLARDGHEF